MHFLISLWVLCSRTDCSQIPNPKRSELVTAVYNSSSNITDRIVLMPQEKRLSGYPCGLWTFWGLTYVSLMLWFAGFCSFNRQTPTFYSLSISSPLRRLQQRSTTTLLLQSDSQPLDMDFMGCKVSWTDGSAAHSVLYFWHLLQTTKVLPFASGAGFVTQLPWSGDPTKDMSHGLRLLPCFLLIYWVDILADWRSALSRARLWPSVPVQNCVPLIFQTVLCHLPTFLTFPGGVAELDFLFAEHIYFYIALECWMMTCKTCNNASDYRDDASSSSYFSMGLFVLH